MTAQRRLPIGTPVRTEDGWGYVAQVQGDAVVVRGLPQPVVYSREQVYDLLDAAMERAEGRS